MPTRPTPISEAEAIFEPFWDPATSPLKSWRFSCDASLGGSAQPFWCGAMLKWDRGGGVVARMSRQVDWDLSGHDSIMICLNPPATARLTLRVTTDRGEQACIVDAPGRGTFVEFEGGISGFRVLHVEWTLVDDAPTPGAARLMWLGVFNRAKRDAARAAAGIEPERLERFLQPEDSAVTLAPRLGLFFGGADLDAIRRRARSPLYAPAMAQLRERAAAALTGEPWRGVGRFPNMGGARCGRGQSDGPIDPLMMRLAAFVGLIDGDSGLLRAALRHALAMAHCEYWFPDFMEAFPGSAFEQRAFFDYRYGVNVVFAWDWAGAWLTPEGHNLFAHAVAHKALPRIQMTLMRHRYVRGCNQGAYMAYGAIVCGAALAAAWPYGGDFLPPAIAALDQTMNTYIAPDGGAFEGVGYVSSTLGHALAAYQLVARRRGVPLRDVVPPHLARSADFLATMLSTAEPLGSSINVADGGRPGKTLYPECLPFLASISDSPAMASLLAGMLSRPLTQESFATPGLVFCVLFGPEAPPNAAASPPVFHVLEATGQLCSCRPTPDGPVRLQLIGAPAQAGHSHEDKGSFVIEAFGEEIAIDRGQMEYSDPRCSLLPAARFHNVLAPLTPTGDVASQVNPCRDAVLPRGEGDQVRLRAEVDAGAAWGGLATRWVRRIESDQPREFLVRDELDLPAPGRAAFLLHSRFPWTPDGRGGWSTTGERATLTVRPDWPVDSVRAGEEFVEGGRKPAHTLALHTTAGASHRLVTRLSVAPAQGHRG